MLILLGLQKMGMRKIEALVLMLVVTIAGCYFFEIFVLPATHPSFFEMGKAMVHPRLNQAGMMLLAVEIVGRDGDAAQFVSALGSRSEPKAAEG